MNTGSMNRAILFSLFMLLFFGCKKYEEDENTSLRTARTRLTKRWVQTGIETDPNSAVYHTTSLVFRNDNTFLIDEAYPNLYKVSSPGSEPRVTIVTYTGSWKFKKSRSEVSLDYNGNHSDETWIIRKLTSKDFSFSLQSEPLEKITMVTEE